MSYLFTRTKHGKFAGYPAYGKTVSTAIFSDLGTLGPLHPCYGPSTLPVSISVIEESHALHVREPRFVSNVASRMLLICQPCLKLSRISAWVTRLGPQEPGSRSLKHIMRYVPPGFNADARVFTKTGRFLSGRT